MIWAYHQNLDEAKGDDVPRLADHEQRRREITGAARTVIAGGGLDAATFQSVAAAARISVRTVQYYFGNKRELLLATRRAVIEDAGARFGHRMATLGAEPSGRAALRAILIELLPLDDARREDSIVLDAFHTAALTGSDVAPDNTADATRALMTIVAEQLRHERPGAPDTELDAELIALAVAALTQSILAGMHTRESALGFVDHLLIRVLGPAPSTSQRKAHARR
ncbi:TetR/AcrR family transcriptional regulator [Nocardia sp. NPDC052566]|uniref:TetR/AcrR family transcriptional regulator n=1 Tax=Nocardia sp. NPDC052566 TaxID=3364330 RepID=UPI0037C517AC